ncbi:MAG: histidine ammonia-lyase [Bacteroidetes bacterium HGW-Bacteroidetes-4]|jgi:histidine ammonia-lyase|nr:MAG: histidine ammonia-lyase [Bacteroidetes bacterium HGW-Bacteroidetes-4]
MTKVHYITPDYLTFERIEEIIEGAYLLELSEQAVQAIVRCREYLDKKVATHSEPIYGINTGFGSLCNKSISNDELGQLQKNLVMSHACGTGDLVRPEIIKLMLLLKAHALSMGKSGVQLQTVQRIIDMYNHEVLPVVFELGSLGASGDLAPLANLFLPLIGMGEVYYQGLRLPADQVMEQLGWEPIELQSKEGLALLNGTQFMSAHAVYSLLKAFRLIKFADIIGATSLEAFDGRLEPFNDLLHQIRPHSGQIETAKNIRNLLAGSQIMAQPKKHVQDPYSFRCIPQVHGATKDSVKYIAQVVEIEINSVTDNPTVFPDEDMVLSGGNFHGQPLALNLDYLAIAMAELGNISERRTAQLILGLRGLPEFLVANPGLNSGFMIPQYAAAGIVSQNKQLCTPASVDSIVSSNGQEDHVSMGANAATKALRVVENVERILAVELMNAAQALDLRKPLRPSPYIDDFVSQFRLSVEFIHNDKVMYQEMELAVSFLQKGKFGHFD